MFKVNDYVMYGTIGVCRIIDICKEKYLNPDTDEAECYVLQRVYSDKYSDKMTIKIPVNNQKVLMRELLTKEDVQAVIETVSKAKTTWINDDRRRSASFKAILKRGDGEECMKLIKTLYIEKKHKSASGKRLGKSDETIMKAAEKLLYQEFAMALGISPDEVLPYICKHLE